MLSCGDESNSPKNSQLSMLSCGDESNSPKLYIGGVTLFAE